MDNVIFEDPSKQRPRAKRSSQVQPLEVIPNQNDPADGEQRRCAPSQSPDAFDAELDGSGRLSKKSTNYINCDEGGQVRDIPARLEFDPAGVTASSVLELFSMSDGDRYSVDDESTGQRDSLFSSPEPEGSAVDSDTSVYSIVDKRGEAPTLERLDSYDRAGRGKDQAIFFEDGVSDGDAANWVALQNEMLESEVGKPGLRIRPSPTDRDENGSVEPCTERDNSERDDDVYHATTARSDRQRTRNAVEGRTGKLSLPNHSSRIDATRVVGLIQQSTLNDSRRNLGKTASPPFPLSRKRGGAALPESPSMGLDVSIDQISCQKKVWPSRSSQTRRAIQKARAMTGKESRLDSPLPGLRSRSLSCEIPSSSAEARQDVEEEVVWEYRRLLDYRIVNGKPLVLVAWNPTWEPPDEYPAEEVDSVRRNSQRQMQVRRRGRPRSKQNI